MTPETSATRPGCEDVQARQCDALLSGDVPSEADRDHASGCAACGRSARELAALHRALAADAPAEASDALVGVTLARARAELSRHEASRAGLPDGYSREVGRLVGAALLPLPAVLAWNAAVLGFGGALLSGIVPATLLEALGAGYVLAGATWLGCLYGSLPLVAHRRMRRRALEMA